MNSFVISDQNWCFDEYSFFKDSIAEASKGFPKYEEVFKESLIFTVCGDTLSEITPSGFSNDFDDWYENIGIIRLHKTLPKEVDEFRAVLNGIPGKVKTFIEKKLIESIRK